MAYCAYTDVNNLTNIATADVANATVTEIIKYATYKLNKDISTLIVREEIEDIDSTRENDIDGSNTTYYVKNWKGKFIADMNDDGDVTTADIIVYKVDSEGTETLATVSTIDPENGKFVLSAAPASGTDLYVTYRWSYANCQSSDTTNYDNRVKMACVLLTAAYCYMKLNWGKAVNVSFGSTRFIRHMDSVDKYYREYQKIIDGINDQMLEMRESTVGI